MTDFLDMDERIRLAIRIGESHYREFKSAWLGPPSSKAPRPIKDLMTDIGRTLVAFANADGGELLIGVEDDGTITGTSLSPSEIAHLLDATRTHVHADTPLPEPRKRVVTIDGCQGAYFSVSKGVEYIHLTSDGRCLKRSDRDSLPASAEKIAATRIEDQSRRWDRDVAFGVTLDDLDLDLVQGVASQILYGISVEKCLQYLDLAEFTPDGLRLKKAATLLFAKDSRRWQPGCYVRIITVRGKEKRTGEGYNVIKDDIVNGNLLQLIDLAWERLTYALSLQTQLTESARFQQTLMYPQIACREALINAIVHRNYAIEGRGIEVSIYQDRLEILSPGMILSTISLDDLRTLRGVHESRNPLIARVLRELGFVREMGEGIRRMFDVMRSSALAEPEIDSDTTGFTVTLYHRSLYDPKVKLWLGNFDHHKLTESQTAVMALGYGGREFSTQEIIDRLGIVNVDLVREILTPLRQRGLIERTKNTTEAYKFANKMRIPKREVPIFRVVNLIDAGARTTTSAAEEQDDTDGKTHRIFVGKIPYFITRAELVQWLSQHCEVLEISLPAGHEYGSSNKGFAFATVSFPGETSELVTEVEEHRLGGQLILVRPNRS